ncbi:bifunctional UDP-sugar hydrolase/5'-nucleotidase [Brachybacterium sp. FME24]|uniref:bifunctional metallophosphatase/5'-nucleotidase n=1 Tax=Brachybacterium sp. FME24 TaxID=2742605 RepID=UPI00186911E7|nr:bifunctional UDP-sugar hydrolase/5'-nucleotidase [Brachybacterium sp. FME24]
MVDTSVRRLARGASVGLGAAAVAFAASVVPLGAAVAAEPGDEVNLLTFNDFHGALSVGDPFACTVANTQALHANTTLLSAGDNVGGSEFSSAVQDDQPTIDFLNALGVSAGAIGNHEYDQGYTDLLDRIEPATDFPDLAANVYQEDGSRPHDAYAIVDAGDVKVAVIGAVTTKTVGKVSPAAIEGLTFGDPVDAVNDAVGELEASGEEYDVIVASYHEGASGNGEPGSAPANSDPIFDKIVTETSPEVDAIFNGDSHQTYAYDAPVPGQDGEVRPVVQAGSSGEFLGSVTLTLGEDDDWDVTDGGTELIATEGADLGACAGDPAYQAASAVSDQALADAAEAGSRPVGSVTGDITTAWDSSKAEYVDGVWTATGATGGADIKGDDRTRFSANGNMLADSMKWFLGQRGGYEDQEVIGWMNPGGLRSELWYGEDAGEGDGVVTYGEANNVVRFGNTLNTGEVTGEQFAQMLEEQWLREADGTDLGEFAAFGVSENVTYIYDGTREQDDRITDVRINGEELDPDATYTIVAASFLFEGGDSMHTLAEAQNVQDTGVIDRDALAAYFDGEEQQDLAPDFAQRQVELQVLNAGEYDSEAGVDTDPVLRIGNLESLSLGAPEISSVVVDAGEYGTFEAPYTLLEEAGRHYGDVTLTDWLCVPEGTEVPLNITAIPDSGTAVTVDIPSFTWSAGGAPEGCADGGDDDTTPPPSDDGDDDATPPPSDDGDDDATTPPSDGQDDDTTPPPSTGGDVDGGATAPPSDEGDATSPPAAGGSSGGSADRDNAGGSSDRSDLARTGADVGPLAAGIGLAALAGLGALGLRHRLSRE